MKTVESLLNAIYFAEKFYFIFLEKHGGFGEIQSSEL